ncbi:hypothetical protein J1N35_034429, partial [Gossypium stocksii]
VGLWLLDYIIEASGIQTERCRGKVSAESALAVSTSKFKQCSVSIVRDFLPGCESATMSNYGLIVQTVRDFLPRCRRVTASNYGLIKQIAIDHSAEG